MALLHTLLAEIQTIGSPHRIRDGIWDASSGISAAGECGIAESWPPSEFGCSSPRTPSSYTPSPCGGGGGVTRAGGASSRVHWTAGAPPSRTRSPHHTVPPLTPHTTQPDPGCPKPTRSTPNQLAPVFSDGAAPTFGRSRTIAGRLSTGSTLGARVCRGDAPPSARGNAPASHAPLARNGSAQHGSSVRHGDGGRGEMRLAEVEEETSMGLSLMNLVESAKVTL